MSFDPATIKTFPRAPGVYLMRDARGAVLYVGKANDLRARVGNYFRAKGETRAQIQVMLQHVSRVETIVTDSEKEALLLEHTLIKRHHPKYNIIHRDDKTYASVRVSLAHAFPGVCRTRRILKDGAAYFGPYPSGLASREMVELVTRFFRLRICSDREFANRARPCLQYQIGRCSAPCVGLVSREDYRAQVAQAQLLLQGRRNELSDTLTTQMRAAAAAEQYEEAARVRDLLRDITVSIEPQKVVRHAGPDRDYIGWAEEAGQGAVAVLEVRDGNLVERGGAVVPLGGDASGALLESYAVQYYQPPRVPPPVIVWPAPVAPFDELRALLSERRGAPVRLHHPRRGKEAEFLRLAATNARAICTQSAETAESWDQLRAAIQQELDLPVPPAVIECVDVSTLQGAESVAALVCFRDGIPAKDRYRLFRIRETPTDVPNDYAMLHEVLTRRCRSEHVPALPDLLVIDGGKGQLQIATRVLQEFDVTTLPLAAIAKPREGEATDKIFLPGRKNPLNLRPHHPVLLFFQRLRDETHRFAISFHRKRRDRASSMGKNPP